MKIITIIGAWSQFIKAAPVSRRIKELKDSDGEDICEIIVHTGRHYDDNMSKKFFDELNIPIPDYNLEVGSFLHGKQTALMLEKIEDVLIKEMPDVVLVYGDTNSTLAGALAAGKLNIPIAHVEAGVRSYNRIMPEEVNRVITDKISTMLFCPTETAIRNLKKEGIEDCGIDAPDKDFQNNKVGHPYFVKNVGDVMYDSVLYNAEIAEKRCQILEDLDLINPNDGKIKRYTLATIHRQVNTGNKDSVESIIAALLEIGKECPVILPLHPRTKKTLEDYNIDISSSNTDLKAIPTVSYLDMLLLEKNANVILTDSGGVQKEAYFFKVPCVTLREETEWVETVDSECSFIVGNSTEKILFEYKRSLYVKSSNFKISVFGDGHAGEKIVNFLKSMKSSDRYCY